MSQISLNHFRPHRKTTRAAWLDSLLRLLGPSWRAAPIRRLIQTAFFLFFLYLFFCVSWPYAETFHADLFSEKEHAPAESFLLLDPLVGLSTAIAGRAWNVALAGTAIVLVASLLVPRGFCSYVCPLGTTIDLFDGLVGRWFRPKRRATVAGWRYLRYYLLTGVLVAAAFGTLLVGYVSAIPVFTRAVSFLLAPLQLGLMRNWSQVREIGWGEWFSISLFALILLAGLLRQRFWCRYLCPSGALFSLIAKLRLTHRHVTAECIQCGRCVEACAFDALDDDFTTRGLDCTWCQTCGGACPVGAIQFAPRVSRENLTADNPPAAPIHSPSRRGFLAAGAAATAIALGMRSPRTAASQSSLPIRPPGSLPEPEFLARCVRCGQCYQACPGPVLRPAGTEAPFQSLWTPVADMLHAGCHQDCNFCTQVCPTGAIRPLTIAEKRRTPMGLAVVRTDTCLAHTGEEFCRLCADECDAAGYHAIEMRSIELSLGDIPEGVLSDEQIEAMRHTEAPFVNPDTCVGCGLCQYRCHAALVKQRKQLHQSAIYVEAMSCER